MEETLRVSDEDESSKKTRMSRRREESTTTRTRIPKGSEDWEGGTSRRASDESRRDEEEASLRVGGRSPPRGRVESRVDEPSKTKEGPKDPTEDEKARTRWTLRVHSRGAARRSQAELIGVEWRGGGYETTG